MTDRTDAVEATTLEDYVALLADAQYDDNRNRRWLLPAAVLMLGLALGLDDWAGKLAACATLATFGYWLRVELQWSGRYWFLHLVLKQDLIRPPQDITAGVITAVLEIDDAVRATQTLRSSEGRGPVPPEQGESAEPRHSAASSEQEGPA